MNTEAVQERIEDLPTEPGVYIFKSEGVPLYVGKAVNIRDRVRSYKQPRNQRIAAMVAAADSLETRVTQDESEALLLEANLIKKFEPQYNVRLKDGKSYPVIELTNHTFPQLRATRNPEESSRIYGPFTDMGRIQRVIKALSDLYGVRNHSDHIFEKYRKQGRPCVDYQIGLCAAPCAGYISEDDYRERVEAVVNFFQGETDEVLEQLQREMEQAAEEEQFERAATLRDYINHVKSLRGTATHRETGITHAINTAHHFTRIGVAVVERGTIMDTQTYRLTETAETQQDALRAFITQFYARDELPDTIIVPHPIKDQELHHWLDQEGVQVIARQDKRSEILLSAAKRAAGQASDKRMAALSADLEIAVTRVEGFDVSHSGGKDVVGSNVVFDANGPVKSDYRRKKLVETNDDYQNMYELVKWRAQRATEYRDDRPDPDLLLIDGGRGQLKAARRALQETGWSVPFVGIVKPGDDIIALHQDPDVCEDARNLLSAVRDEAHRFAVAYHTIRRDNVNSVLEQIDGIGKKTAQNLLTHFNSVDAIRDASEDELMEVGGIGKHTAEKIRAHVTRGL